METAGEPLIDIGALKKQLRLEALARRDSLSSEQRAEGSAAVAHRLLELGLASGARVSAFLPIKSEIDLRPAISGLVASGHVVGLPIMRKPDLIFRAFTDEANLVPLGFGTIGPGPDAPEIEPDVMLVPLSAFDRAGGRIGYGKAFYDITIARIRGEGRDPLLIGVGFSVQETASVPMEAHDVALHAIITERETIRTPAGRTKDF